MKRPLSLAVSGPARLWNSGTQSRCCFRIFDNFFRLDSVDARLTTFVCQADSLSLHRKIFGDGMVPSTVEGFHLSHATWLLLRNLTTEHQFEQICFYHFLSSFSVASFAAAGIWCRLHLRFSCMQPCQPFDASMSKGNIVRIQSERWQIRQSTIISKPMLTFAGCQWEPQPEWIEQPLFAPALSNFVG